MSPLAILLLQPIPQAVVWGLLHFLWQGALVALTLRIVLRLGRLWTPEARYAVCCGAMALLLLLPALTVASEYHTRETGVTWTGLETRVTAARPVNVSAPTRPSRAPAALSAVVLQFEQRVRPLFPWLLGLWLLGVLGFGVRGIAGHRQVARWRRAATPAGSGLQARLADLLRRAGIRREVELLLCASVTGPGAVGWLRPAILFPPALALHLTPWQLELVLAHELAHIRRHDYVVNLVQTLAEILLFFHPSVWWISEQTRLEREHACDRFAVALTGDAVGYARTLTEVAAAMAGPLTAPALALTHPPHPGGPLMARITRILGIPHPARRDPWSPLAIGATLAALIVSVLVTTGAVAQDVPAAGVPSADRSRQQIEIVERANALRGGPLVALRRALADPDPLTRAAAVRVAGEGTASSEAPTVLALLRDPAEHVRRESAIALGMMNHEPAQPALLSALKDPAPGVREQAAYALAIIGVDHRGKVEAITPLLQDPAASVREGAARALRLLRDDTNPNPNFNFNRDGSTRNYNIDPPVR